MSASQYWPVSPCWVPTWVPEVIEAALRAAPHVFRQERRAKHEALLYWNGLPPKVISTNTNVGRATLGRSQSWCVKEATLIQLFSWRTYVVPSVGKDRGEIAGCPSGRSTVSKLAHRPLTMPCCKLHRVRFGDVRPEAAIFPQSRHIGTEYPQDREGSNLPPRLPPIREADRRSKRVGITRTRRGSVSSKTLTTTTVPLYPQAPQTCSP
jgi:hypothetical protein